MSRVRLFLILGAHLAVGAVLLGWAVLEGQRQQRAIEQALVSEASSIAGALGPGLSAASNAAREFDEIVTWKLLDNARLLSAIAASGSSSSEQLDEIVEANGLDTVAFVAPDGAVERAWGERPPAETLRAMDDVLSGRADELVLGSTLEAGIAHVGVAVRTPAGGAVLVRIEATSARTFVSRLGVANLLDRLVGTAGVLFLSYHEEPGTLSAQASWDDGPVPDRPTTDSKIRPLRGRVAFETEVPVTVPAGVIASLRVGLDGAPLERAAASGMRRTLLVGIVLAGYAMATAGLSVVSRLLGMEREDSARRLAAAESARRRNERLAAAGALTAGLAHEVRSPLNAIGLAAQRLERKHHDDDECRAFAGRIRREVSRLETVLREFLDLARPVEQSRQRVDLAALASEVVDLLRPQAESHGVSLEPVQGRAVVQASPEAIRRSVINLLNNAIEASPEGGRVRVIVEGDLHEGRLRVLDEGPGIDPDLRDKMFEAFVTTRADGAGLGLSLVKRVAEEHGGRCLLIDREQGGAEARLSLPSSAKEPA
jgi:signal transduction histidine kinase